MCLSNAYQTNQFYMYGTGQTAAHEAPESDLQWFYSVEGLFGVSTDGLSQLAWPLRIVD